MSDHGDYVHIMPLSVLVKVFLALVVLTVVTVAVAQVDLGGGPANVLVALAIAFVKASLVAAYFMHLKYAKGLNIVVFLISILFVGIMIVFVMADTEFYKHEVEKYELENPSK